MSTWLTNCLVHYPIYRTRARVLKQPLTVIHPSIPIASNPTVYPSIYLSSYLPICPSIYPASVHFGPSGPGQPVPSTIFPGQNGPCRVGGSCQAPGRVREVTSRGRDHRDCLRRDCRVGQVLFGISGGRQFQACIYLLCLVPHIRLKYIFWKIKLYKFYFIKLKIDDIIWFKEKKSGLELKSSFCFQKMLIN